MKPKRIASIEFCSLFCVLCSTLAFGQRSQRPTPPTDWFTPEIPGVVAADTKIEVVKSGRAGGDGPVALPDGTVAMMADGGLVRLDKDGNISVLVDKVDGAGLAVDSKGRIIAAQSSGKVVVLYPKGSEAVLADSFEGKPFIHPNDLVVDKKDGIYFTDPYSLGGPEKPTPPLPQAVYYIPPGGKPKRVAVGISRPNGISLSQDGATLYVNDWGGEYMLSYDVQPDGTLTNRRDFARYTDVNTTAKGYWGVVSGADGLAIDDENRTYSYLSKDFTTPVGIQVFSPAGQLLGTIPIPLQGMGGNLGFGGPDKKDLYVVGRGAIFKIHMLARGPQNRAK